MTDSTRNRGTDGAKLISIIETKALRGNGTKEAPYREVIEFWKVDGIKIGEMDPFIENEGCKRRKKFYGQNPDGKIEENQTKVTVKDDIAQQHFKWVIEQSQYLKSYLELRTTKILTISVISLICSITALVIVLISLK